MIKSMTAFGRAKREGADKDITIEIKSVNSRFFDCNVKLPRAYIFLEERIKEHVRRAVSRAKVDVYVTDGNIKGNLGRRILAVTYDYAASDVGAVPENGVVDVDPAVGAQFRDVFMTDLHFGQFIIIDHFDESAVLGLAESFHIIGDGKTVVIVK